MVKAFVDDIVFAGLPENILKTIDYINLEGKQFGYSINFGKSDYILGKSHLGTDYFDYISKISERGIIVSSLILHPSLLLNNYNKIISNIDLHNSQYDSNNFGFQLLGSYVGDSNFISHLKN